jgi:hypothetical protein
MVTLYILVTLALTAAAVWAIWSVDKKKFLPIVVIVPLIFWGMYEMFFENFFAKRYGGTLTVTAPEGHKFFGVTWKDDDLWVGYYNPDEKKCRFEEYSKFSILEGKVVVKNCNPIGEGQ